MELTTAVKHEMHITHVLLDNGELGKISKERRAAHRDVWQPSLHNPNFAAFAELCGAKSAYVTDHVELDDAVRAGLDHRGPGLVEMTDALLV